MPASAARNNDKYIQTAILYQEFYDKTGREPKLHIESEGKLRRWGDNQLAVLRSGTMLADRMNIIEQYCPVLQRKYNSYLSKSGTIAGNRNGKSMEWMDLERAQRVIAYINKNYTVNGLGVGIKSWLRTLKDKIDANPGWEDAGVKLLNAAIPGWEKGFKKAVKEAQRRGTIGIARVPMIDYADADTIKKLVELRCDSPEFIAEVIANYINRVGLAVNNEKYKVLSQLLSIKITPDLYVTTDKTDKLSTALVSRLNAILQNRVVYNHGMSLLWCEVMGDNIIELDRDTYELIESRLTLYGNYWVNTLKPSKAYIVTNRVSPKTYREIAEDIGTTKENIADQYHTSCRKLREKHVHIDSPNPDATLNALTELCHDNVILNARQIFKSKYALLEKLVTAVRDAHPKLSTYSTDEILGLGYLGVFASEKLKYSETAYYDVYELSNDTFEIRFEFLGKALDYISKNYDKAEISKELTVVFKQSSINLDMTEREVLAEKLRDRVRTYVDIYNKLCLETQKDIREEASNIGKQTLKKRDKIDFQKMLDDGNTAQLMTMLYSNEIYNGHQIEKTFGFYRGTNDAYLKFLDDYAGFLSLAGFRPKLIEDLSLRIRAENCLKRARINYVDELVALMTKDNGISMLEIRNLGVGSLYQIIDRMKTFDLLPADFKPDIGK